MTVDELIDKLARPTQNLRNSRWAEDPFYYGRLDDGMKKSCATRAANARKEIEEIVLNYNNEKLERLLWITEHLFTMISEEDWKATGGDDGQGHYEGLYHAEQLQVELGELRELLGPHNG